MELKTQVVMDGVVWLVTMVSVWGGAGKCSVKCSHPLDRQINYENHVAVKFMKHYKLCKKLVLSSYFYE